MTVTSTNQKVSFSGNGSTTVFAYNFKIFAQTDLLVILRSATGTETTQQLTSNYTVSGVGATSGGNVTMGVAPPSGTTLVIQRVQPQLQGLDLVPNDPFPAQSMEDALDKLVFNVQSLNEEVGRAIKASTTNTIGDTEFTISATDRANKLFSFDSSGNLSIAQELGTYRGNWAASTAYAVRDLVKDTSTNNIFIVITAHTSSGSQPITTNTDAAKWALIVDAASATTSASTATTKANEAAASAVLASQWAIKTDDTVDGTNYSAKYWATRSDVAAVAGKATEIGRLGTSDAVADMAILGTSDVVADMNTLGTAAIVEDMNLLGTSANVTAMGLLGTSAAVADMAILGTSDVVADMAILGTTDVVADMNTLGTSDVVSDMNTLATSDIVTDMNLLATSANVAAMGKLGLDAVIADMALLGTDAVVADLAILGTTDVVADMNTLATSDIVSDMNTLGTSANVTAMGLLGTSAVVTDMGLLGTAAVVEDMGILGTSANVTAMSNVSGSIGNVNTVATNLSGITAFSAVYSSGGTDPSSNLNAGDLFFNTSSDSLKIYDGSNWVAGVTAGSGFLPLSGGTMTGNLVAGDNVKATFGSGSDLEIFHNGSNSYISEEGTGDLLIRGSSNIYLAKSDGSETYARFEADGAASLYHNNAVKMATSASGISVTGNVAVTGTVDGVDLQTLNNAVTANTAKTGITSSQTSAITANTAKTTNATHSGEVTGSGALTIANNVVDEANLKVSNGPTNGYFLSAQSGNTGGLTWAEVEGGTSLPFPEYPSNWASPNNTYTSSGTWSKGSLADDAIVWMYLSAGGQGGNSGPYAYSGGGGDVVLLCGSAGLFNGASYTIGAGGSGITNGTAFQPGPVGGNTTLTLSSGNGSVPFSTNNFFTATQGGISNVDFFTEKVIYIDGAATDAVNSFMSNVGAYEFKQGTLPVTGGVTYSYWSEQGFGNGTAVSLAGWKTVFAGGNGGTGYNNSTGSPGVSLYAGQGGARGSSSANGANGGVPGGGGGSSVGTSRSGGNGGAGNLRVYHV